MVEKCVLCLEDIPVITKPEHVLLNALGGRMTVDTVICPTCNNKMGMGPDYDLAQSVAFIRNIGGLSTGDGNEAPKIRGLETNGVKFDLHPGMKTVIRPKNPMKLEISEDEIKVDIIAYSDAEADMLLTGAATSIAKKLGHDSPAVIEAIKRDLDKDREVHLVPAPEIHHQSGFGFGRSQQAMAKACLVLLAKRIGNAEVITSKFDAIRKFIWDGVKPEAPEKLVKIDTRNVLKAPEKYGLNPNVIWVGSDANGKTYGYFRLFGAIGWRFLLCESGAPSSVTACLISNPLNPREWGYVEDDGAIFEAAYILNDWDSAYNFEDVSNAFEPLIAPAPEAALESAYLEWLEEGLKEAGWKDGDIITREHLGYLKQFLAPRFEAMLSKQPVKLKPHRGG